ncbi:MAG: hypothetical protein INQ03_25760 [Candidatus Heimdallarchaeota archaeon]|nr:hypothetical protein [Candidatus Heimdallarchaeota archaeon]
MSTVDPRLNEALSLIKSKEYSKLKDYIEKELKSEDKTICTSLNILFDTLFGQILTLYSNFEIVPDDMIDLANQIINWMECDNADQDLIMAYKARIAMSIGNYEECISISDSLQHIDNEKLAWNIVTQLAGISYYMQGKYTNAIKEYDKLLAFQEKVKDRSWANNIINKAECLYRIGEINESYGLLEMLLQHTYTGYADERSVEHHRATVLTNMAVIDILRNEFDMAEKALLQARKIDESHGMQIYSRYMQLIRCSLHQNDLHKAENYLKDFEKFDNIRKSPRYKLCKAMIYSAKSGFSNKAKALMLIDEVIETSNMSDTLHYAVVEKIKIMIEEYSLSKSDEKLNEILLEIQQVQKKAVFGGQLLIQLRLIRLESMIYRIQNNFELALHRLNEGIHIASEKDMPSILQQLYDEVNQINEILNTARQTEFIEKESYSYLLNYLETIKIKYPDI